MKNEDCVQFLQWALPKMHMRWAGFRRVHRQVCKRIFRRMSALNIDDMSTYQHYLQVQPEEWKILDSLCRISISRFYRDRSVFDSFNTHIFPYLCSQNTTEIRVCSLGCCSGEEPYTVQMIWDYYIKSSLKLTLVAVDNDSNLLRRAMRGRYQVSSIKELPADLHWFFNSSGKVFQLKEKIRKNVKFFKMDLRKNLPPGIFDIILCRNLVFTYYDEKMQEKIFERLINKISFTGLLITGIHEKLPSNSASLEPFNDLRGVFRRVNHCQSTLG